MKVPFKYYLHDNYSSGERAYEIAEQVSKQGVQLPYDSDELSELIGRPFEEVTLECELDTVTGEVTLIKASL